jgi:serine/threonine-protein kinase
VLADFRRDAASDGALAGLAAPTCSISAGAGGVGWALTRIGALTGDESALADAERWLTEAERRSTNPDAFDDGDELTSSTAGLVSPFHRESGIAVARACLAAATGDRERHQAALDGYCAATAGPCDSLDLTLGRSSVLLVAALLLRQADRSWPATGRLMRHGDAICAAVWREATDADVAYNGIAHGLAGLAYAAMMWARERGAPPPEGVRDALDRLAGIAEPHGRGVRWALSPSGAPGAGAFWLGWCHGSAGYVFLWNLARETYGDDAYGALAEQAAWPLDRTVGATSLCCGTAGMVYAALNMHRSGDGDRWRSLATRLAERSASSDALAGDATSPLSLYKGHVGLALLAVELEDPSRAAMPLFEADAAVSVPSMTEEERGAADNLGRPVAKVGAASPLAAPHGGP